MATSAALSRADILDLFAALGAELERQEVFAEIAVCGSSAMLIQFPNQTRVASDIDFLPLGDEDTLYDLYAAADTVGAARGLPPDWLSDAIASFSPEIRDWNLLGDFPPGGRGGLRVFVATPRYQLALKLTSCRHTRDADDIEQLMDRCGITDVSEVETLAGTFFPGRIPDTRATAIAAEMLAARASAGSHGAARAW